MTIKLKNDIQKKYWKTTETNHVVLRKELSKLDVRIKRRMPFCLLRKNSDRLPTDR